MEFLVIIITGILLCYLISKNQVKAQYEKARLLVRLEAIEQALNRIEESTVDRSYEIRDEARDHHSRMLLEFERSTKRIDSLESFLLEDGDNER